ncbi:hypothetical protein C2S51_020769, partial [Perilla frutescens var. frutescens]
DHVDKRLEFSGLIDNYDESESNETETESDSEAEFESSPSDYECEHNNIFSEVDIYSPCYALNQVFSSKKVFRESIHSHAIQTRRNIKIVKNDERRVYAKCLGLNCEWRINLLKINKEQSWQVREYHSKHNCSASMNVSNVKSAWLAKKFEEEFRSDAKRSTQGFRLDAIRHIKVNVSHTQAYRAKRKALHSIDGSYESQYAKLWDYAQILRSSNPGSTVIMALEEAGGSNAPKRFSKMYICFDALKKGFLSGCRPIIGVDGCFLKGPHKGQLLTACTLDPNNDTYVIAYAIVKSETRENWEWFLALLKEDLMIERTDMYTFMSDKQKGLIPAFESMFPGAEHRFCVRHLHGNMKMAGFKGNAFKNALWTAARASTIPAFSKAMQDIRKLDPGCVEWLYDKPPSQWSRSHFKEDLKCDILTNNMCESFNNCILDAKDRSILTMLEWIRQYLMRRLSTYRDRAVRNWEGRLLYGRIAKMLDRRKNKAADCIPLKSDDWNYEIECFDGERVTVDLKSHTCSCRDWNVSGIPCKHAVSAMYAQGLNPEDFVDKFFTVEKYGVVYEHSIRPMDGPLMWNKTGYIAPLPPNFGRRAGRPTKARRHEPDELPKRGRKRQTETREKEFRLGKKIFKINHEPPVNNHEAAVDEEMVQVEETTQADEMTQEENHPLFGAVSVSQEEPRSQLVFPKQPSQKKVNIRAPAPMAHHAYEFTSKPTASSSQDYKVITKGGKKFVTLSELVAVGKSSTSMQKNVGGNMKK